MFFFDYVRRHTKQLKWSALVGISLALFLGSWPSVSEKYFSDGNSVVKSSGKVVRPSPTMTPSPTPLPIPELSMEEIMQLSYEKTSSVVEDVPAQYMRQVMLGGDVMLGRAVGFNMVRKKDFYYPFLAVGEKLRKADATIVNLENPVTDDCAIETEGMIFCSSPGTVSTLQYAGVDLVNLANNHTLNHGAAGLQQTVRNLEEADIAYTGTGKEGVIEVRGLKIGVLGYLQLGGNGGLLEEANKEVLETEVGKLKESVDVVLVTFHWGAEYVAEPTMSQRALAFAAIEAGADGVFGHHPHWVQGMELYQGRPIFYSLGNLVFDQMWSKETREGLVVELNFYNDKLLEVQLHPVFMENFAQPEWMPRGYGNSVLANVEGLSKRLMETQGSVERLE